MGNGAWSNDQITSLVIPTGATTGARVEINGLTGQILVYNSSNVLVGQFDPTGLWVYDADGSYVHVFDENPGDGAVIQLRPASSVGTINAPAQIGVATDPITGGIGTSFVGATINGKAPGGLYLNQQGLFLDAPAATGGGLMVLYADAGIVIQAGPNGDVEIQDQAGVTRVFMAGATGLVSIDNATIPGGSLSARAVYDRFSGPAVAVGTAAAAYANVPGSTAQVFTKSYTSTSFELNISGGGYSSAAATGLAIGININGFDQFVDSFVFNQINTHHKFGSFGSFFAGNAPGNYTCQMRWRVYTGAGTVSFDQNDVWSMSVKEVK